MTTGQKNAVKSLLRSETIDEPDNGNVGIFESVRKRPKLEAAHGDSMYISTKFILPTTNHVERLFSQCKLILRDNRNRLGQDMFEGLVMLKLHKEKWNELTIERVRNK